VRGLAEQIAVLDGLDGLEAGDMDGRIGQTAARVDQYGRPLIPNVLTRRNVIDASEGGNYSGGSSYAPGLPLLPSSIGLAGTSIIQGGYGRAGLGASIIQGGYGRAGLGQVGTHADADLAAAADIVEAVRASSASDGRIGQQRAQVNQYASMVMPNVTRRTNVLDASEGGNYSGGSSYAPGLPLLPSSIGLAGIPGVLPPKRFVIDPSGGANYSGGSSYAPGMPLLPSSAGLAGLDAVPDSKLFAKFRGRQKAQMKAVAGKSKVDRQKRMIARLQAALPRMNTAQKAALTARLIRQNQMALARLRQIRQMAAMASVKLPA